MFRGASKVTLDSKGRMAIPTRYRDGINARSGGSLVATIDMDHCLLIYPLPDWEEMERRLMRLSGNNRAIRQYQRRIVGHAAEMEMDSHGRILISKELREFAGLDRQAMLIGQVLQIHAIPLKSGCVRDCPSPFPRHDQPPGADKHEWHGYSPINA